MTPLQFLSMHSESAAEFERRLVPVQKSAESRKPGRPSTGGRKPEPKEQKQRHMQAYRQRRKAGLEPLPKPWDYLCSLEVKDMAWQAYRVASWVLRDDMASGAHLTHQALREAFCTTLAEMFEAALSAHAVQEGGCWPLDKDTPDHRDYVQVWADLSGDVPRSWRPEYPVYADMLPASQEVEPATVADRPGSLTKTDSGGSDAAHSRP